MNDDDISRNEERNSKFQHLSTEAELIQTFLNIVNRKMQKVRL
jgi:hypothetical protein